MAGLDFEFLNRIWIGNGHAATEVATALQVIDLDSIHLKIIIAGGAAIHDKVVVYASTANFSGVENLGADARGKSQNLGVIARRQRQTPDFFTTQHMTQRARFGLE